MGKRSRRITLASVAVFILAATIAGPVSAAPRTSPSLTAANYFGAIAVEPKTGASGYAYNYATKAGAKNAALSECKSVANKPWNCQVFVWVKNGCAAVAYKNYANGSRSYSWGIGYTKRQAKNRAKNELGTGARVLTWVCTS